MVCWDARAGSEFIAWAAVSCSLARHARFRLWLVHGQYPRVHITLLTMS